ncbi:ABC transporter, substrate binding protein, PQQ-dependent alcohol dehydrogenase system [Paracoccus isoporae]|uniref:ABC transporter, substrate binding protein, PQQ-dependent alcohol dehydrogenase system n=1 Tax=Paracoccus isoporae TaxID=591205 RepID=A0A1G7GWL1_9RHOB|nr:ABC transporter substrate-binding protein [Paracoccus isoporae]SDE92542.1 ABC transporter, substrate binding protein, PQQ-dependent alcohol dehydrogenase system [Paracoccus isoporae]
MRLYPIIIFAAAAAPATAVEVNVVYLERQTVRPPVLSNLDERPEDLGIAGARLAVEDNASSGKFLGHDYRLDVLQVAPEDAFDPALLGDADLIIADAPPADLNALADARPDALIFNATGSDDGLRAGGCRTNLLHSTPSDAMLADALGQFVASRRWEDLAMIVGPRDEDAALAETYQQSLAKFGAAIESEKIWPFDADLRRSAGAEVPLFTQELGEYDLLLIADSADDFARYVPFNTWLPRPVAGGAGLHAKGWAPVVEQAGAAQLQSRFVELAGRDMAPEDFGAWVAMRSIGEAVTRTGKADAASIRDHVLSDEFELAAFLGRPLSYRGWDGQLRQPVPLVTAEALVAQAPLEGFLHEVNEMDTLGVDRRESECRAFDGG